MVLPLRRYPCSRRAVETGEIVIAATLDDPLLVGEGRYSLEKWGYQAQLSMPLVSHGHVLGVVELSDYQPRDFAEDLDLIRGLGQVAAHALENASLFEQVDRRNRILNELVELGSLASRTRDLDELVRGIAERILGAVDAANCDIYRVVDGVLRCVASFDRSGHDESVLGSIFDLERYPTTADAMFNHQILAISSPEDPQLSEDERTTYRDYGFSSEVCLPLVVNDELYGLLDIYDTRERDFSEYLSFLRSSAQTHRRGLRERSPGRATGAADDGPPRHRRAGGGRLAGARPRDRPHGAGPATPGHDRRRRLRHLHAAGRQAPLPRQRRPRWARHQRRRPRARHRPVPGDGHGGPHRAAHGDLEPRRPAPHRRGAGGHGRVRLPRASSASRSSAATGSSVSSTCSTRGPATTASTSTSCAAWARRPPEPSRTPCCSTSSSAATRRSPNSSSWARRSRTPAAFSELVRSVGPRVVELMEADGCQVFILRNDTLLLRADLRRRRVPRRLRRRPLDLDLFPSTRVSIAEKSALIIESPDDPRLSDYERGLYADSGTQSEICVPMVLEDRVVGLLDVYDHQTAGLRGAPRLPAPRRSDDGGRVRERAAHGAPRGEQPDARPARGERHRVRGDAGPGRGPRERRPPSLRRHLRAQLRHLLACAAT